MTAWFAWDGIDYTPENNTYSIENDPYLAQLRQSLESGWSAMGGTPPSTNEQRGDTVSPTPIFIQTTPPLPNPTTFSVKQPSPSLVQYDANTLPQELIEDLLYEQVGGHELINMARHDTINGQDVSYSLIKNLSIINQVFNPNNIVANQSSYTLKLGEYALDISNKIPDPGSTDYPNGVAYLDSDGNLVIEITSIGQGELLEARITSDGTIYKIGE